jgi:LysM repeat protein
MLHHAIYRSFGLASILGVIVGGLTGCSKVREIAVASTPPGASIYLQEQGAAARVELGKAPLTKQVDFGQKGEKQYTLTASLERYETQSRPLAFVEGSGPLSIQFALKEIYRPIDLIHFQSQLIDNTLKQRGGRISTRAFIDPAEASTFARETQRVTEKLPEGEFYMGAIHSPTEDLLVVPVVKVTRDPAGGTHRVVSSDRLDDLAARYRTTADALMKTNNLSGTSLQEGQILKVPSDAYLAQLWRMAPLVAGTKAALTGADYLDLDPAFSPDGQSLVFSSARFGPNPTLWAIAVDGAGGRRRVTQSPAAEDLQPTVAGEGKELFYTSNPPQAKRPQIWRCTMEGTLFTALVDGESPAASPDGRRVAFVRRDNDTGLRSIWIMNRDGTGESQLSPVADHESADPAWSLDGQWIAFASNQARDSLGQRNFDIWVMRPDGTDRKQITTNGSWDDKPTWDKAGRIYFRSNRGGHWNIWRTRPVLQ